MREYTYQWNPDGYNHRGKEPILKITKSSFGSFQWCPKKYEFSYVQRLPQDQTPFLLNKTHQTHRPISTYVPSWLVAWHLGIARSSETRAQGPLFQPP